MSTLRKNSVAKAAKLPSSPDNSDSASESDSDGESKHRRKPAKKSRLNSHHSVHLSSLSMPMPDPEPAVDVLQNKCDGCIVEASNNIKLQAKTHEIEKLHKTLQTSYMNIETEMLMAYVLFLQLRHIFYTLVLNTIIELYYL